MWFSIGVFGFNDIVNGRNCVKMPLWVYGADACYVRLLKPRFHLLRYNWRYVEIEAERDFTGVGYTVTILFARAFRLVETKTAGKRKNGNIVRTRYGVFSRVSVTILSGERIRLNSDLSTIVRETFSSFRVFNSSTWFSPIRRPVEKRSKFITGRPSQNGLKVFFIFEASTKNENLTCRRTRSPIVIPKGFWNYDR